MRVRFALGVGLALIAGVIGLTLSRSPVVVVGTNPARGAPVTSTTGNETLCQRGESIPGHVTAIRISLAANIGPAVTLRAYSGADPVITGRRDAGWGSDQTVTVAVRPLEHPLRDARVCTTIGPALESVSVGGSAMAAASTGESFRIRLEYLRPGRQSWWSMARSVARRMGLGHAPGGSRGVLLLCALMLAATGMSAWLVARTGSETADAARRIPATAGACAVIAFLSAASWSLITPPFQLPDEPSHFAYAAQLAETGRLPTSEEATFSPEEHTVLEDLRHRGVRYRPERRAVSSIAENRRLQADLERGLSRRSAGEAGVAATEPPLYYALETIPYRLGSGGTLLDRLELMRLLGALLGGISALFAYLFVREALPGVPWAWTTGGLGVALAPLPGFMSGAVNPDVMLCAVSTAIFYCLARGFRRGATMRLNIAIGTLTAAGLLTKLNFLGLAPGVLAGLLLLALRSPRTARRAALGRLAVALAIAVVPAGLYLLFATRLGSGLVSGSVRATGQGGSVPGELAYIWEFYLPRLPGMTNYFPGISAPRQIWFNRSVGLYGWLDTSFPPRVNTLAIYPAGLVLALALRTVAIRRAALRRRLSELAVYALTGVGLLVLVGADSYLSLTRQHMGGDYSNPRYLLPLIALAGGVLALAARGAGRRRGPVAGTLLVLLILAHDVFSQLQVISRFYG
jgi:hypothetical protein